MENDRSTIGSVILSGLSPEEREMALDAMNAVEEKYPRGSVILAAGSVTRRLGIVLEGSVTVENTDFFGSRTILSHLEKGQCFAETYALLGTEPMAVDAVANEDSVILMLDVRCLGTDGDEKWKMKVIRNLLNVSLRKNLLLSNRSFHIARRTIREKILAYLDTVSKQTGSRSFDIPLDRQGLADYLNVDRSAMSRELGKMAEEGIIETRKNHFRILDR